MFELLWLQFVVPFICNHPAFQSCWYVTRGCDARGLSTIIIMVNYGEMKCNPVVPTLFSQVCSLGV